MKRYIKYSVFAVIIVIIIATLSFLGDAETSFQHIQDIRERMEGFYESNPYITMAAYLFVFGATIFLFLPLGVPFLLMAGAVFGLHQGAFLASVANVMGATSAFLVARHLFLDESRAVLGDRIKVISAAVKENSLFYLFLFRLAPVLPSEVVNLGFALTRVNLWTYVWVTFVARYPINYVYVYLGQSLADAQSLSELASVEMMAVLSLIFAVMILGRVLYRKTRSRLSVKVS